MIKKWFLFGSFSFLFNLCGISVYLDLIENKTGLNENEGGILYKVFILKEEYTFLLPPGTKKNIGTWIDLMQQSDIILAPLNAPDDSIFIQLGPESSGKCEDTSMVQSIIYWRGAQNAPSGDKTYQTYCLKEQVVKVGLKIHPNGEPEFYAIEGAEKVGQVSYRS